MSRYNSIKIFISLLVLIAVACSCFNIPGVITPSEAGDQTASSPTWTEALQASTPTWIPLHTSTPPPALPPTSTPTESETPTPNHPTLYADQNYLCLEGPGTSYPHAHDILIGTSYQIIGRSNNGWYQIAISFADSHHTSCWIGGGIVSGDISSIPVVEVPPQNSICGWIENNSTTGAMAPIMTVWGTGQVLQLWNLDTDAINKLNYISPAYFRVFDPVYQAPDLLVNFSSIDQVSSCP
jgi:hypothetical protein